VPIHVSDICKGHGAVRRDVQDCDLTRPVPAKCPEDAEILRVVFHRVRAPHDVRAVDEHRDDQSIAQAMESVAYNLPQGRTGDAMGAEALVGV